MQLNYRDQLMLLKDILSEHESECCGSVAEYEQLERLIRSLMANAEVNDQLKQSLETIYTYCQNRKNSSDITDFIASHQGQLTQWLEDINALS